MIRLRKKLLIFSLVTACVGVGRVLAEGPSPPPAAQPDAGPAETPDLPSPPAVDGDGSTRTRAEISISEMGDRVDQSFRRLGEIMKRMVQLQEVARREKDVIKLNCVADKILQLKELQNIAEQARSNLQEAIARKDEEGRYHEFGRISLSTQQAQSLGGEAEACIGEDLTFIGPTQVNVLEPDLPDDPTTGTTTPDFPPVEPLPVASPQR